MRMRGHNVLHPMGWDAFGLPAENFAIKHKVHPRAAVEKNIATFKDQLAHIGFDYDWSREINTTDPSFYKWTQWIFLQMFKKGLAYQSNEPINWCPSCMTGLANEDLDGNVCERCGSVVEKKALPQWVLKITDYADRMLADLDQLQWPEHIKEAQRNWIGRSEGSEIEFALKGSEAKIKVFTTRADTLFGATYMVLAPEHPLIPELKGAIENWNEVISYISEASKKTEIERSSGGAGKTGVELKGIKAVNPANNEEIPVYAADYVLWGYGTGAIMAVPAHDERDFEFARKFGIPVRQAVVPCETDAENPPKEGLDEARRDTVIVHLRDKKTGKFALLDWHGSLEGLTTAIMGGIEPGQTPEQAALAEIKEEAGLENAVIAKSAPWITAARYFASHKNQNRWAHAWAFIAEIDGTEGQGEISASEQALHTLVWVDEAQVESRLTPEHQKQVWRMLREDGAVARSGYLMNSGRFDGMDSGEARKKITEAVGGRLATNYKLKDWVFSRQRYWGEPIPIIHCPKDGAVAVPEDQLPVVLPEVESYEPSGTGESPLANIESWVNTTCPACGGPARRETNTMPQWAGSSWYYLRFMDPHNAQALVAPGKEKYWAPVDVYVGGDHAVRHLIYARFWHKFLYDIGSVSTIEPFARLEFLGFILAEDGRKMSKRYGNVINPDDVVAEYGADAFRIYEMFMGPFENTIRWNAENLTGSRRFIERIWKLEGLVRDEPAEALEAELHKAIAKVSEDIASFKFNTAVSAMMIFLNAAEGAKAIGREQWGVFLRLLAPFAPHIAEELWHAAGREGSVHAAQWPEADPAKLVATSAAIAVQVNGKVRAAITVPVNASEAEVLDAARAAAGKWLEGKAEQKALYIKGRIASFVV
jgi:leucyl-tRNA synthetase